MRLVNQSQVILSFVVAMFAMVQTAAACSPPEKPLFWIDKRIRYLNDCSYDRAEENYYSYLSGGAVTNIGNGRVTQIHIISSFCGKHEQLTVTDCTLARSIKISGVPNPTDPVDFGGGPETEIKWLIKPHGPIALGPSSELERLSKLAGKHGFEVETDFVTVWRTKRKKNHIDLACGCKLFYPDSIGATQ